jgi:hypothetical protein
LLFEGVVCNVADICQKAAGMAVDFLELDARLDVDNVVMRMGKNDK